MVWGKVLLVNFIKQIIFSKLFYLSALNDCHPNYIIEKKTLSIKAVNEIISQIEKSKL